MIEWGDGIFGCEAAARAYYGKSCAALDVPEAAMMAGAIINPREHNPSRPTRRLLRRQQIILRRMQFKPPAPAAPAPSTRRADRESVDSGAVAVPDSAATAVEYELRLRRALTRLRRDSSIN
jgi:monofunctional biosynthetic peptidoglycan transglycosylase